MKRSERVGQKKHETAIEYLRRAVHNLDHEMESMLQDLKSVDALLDFFDLWHVYGTDFWEGVLESISEGEDPKPAIDFIKKYKLRGWMDGVKDAIKLAKQEAAANV